MRKITIETLTFKAEEAERGNKMAQERFIKNLQDYSPAYAFEWSREAFDAAGRHKVSVLINEWVKGCQLAGKTEEETIKSLEDFLLEEVIRGARWPSRSTSPQSNEMAISELSAKAELLAWMRGSL
jgi:hypothetical protein